MTPNELDKAINKTFDADRAAIPASDPASRERLISMLGTTAPAAISGASGVPAGGFLSAGIGKIVTVAMVTLGLAGGAYLLVPAFTESPNRSPAIERPAPAQPPAPTATISPAPSPAAPNVVDTVAAVTAKPAPEEPRVVQEPAPPIERTTPTPVIDPPRARDTVRVAEPVVVTKDSVRVEVNVNMEGLK
jgi:hypothetical protein